MFVPYIGPCIMYIAPISFYRGKNQFNCKENGCDLQEGGFQSPGDHNQ